jgi:sugar/nucleoside kinase (ribokinase family)
VGRPRGLGTVTSGRRPRLLVVGDVMNDVLVKALEPVTGDTDTRSSVCARPGGQAANQAAWLGHVGAHVIFAGRVGRVDADLHRGELAAFGVEPQLAVDPGAPTGSGVVLVAPDGGRTMFVDRGANLLLSREDLPTALLDDVDAVHLTGYSLCEPGVRGVVLSLLDDVRERRLPFTVDPSSSAFLEPLGEGAFAGWTEGAAVVFPNLDEGRVLTREHAAEDVLERLLAHVPVVVLTLGAEGVLLGRRGQAPVAVPAVAADVYDTTGAGDALCAGFLARWYRDGDAEAAARDGVATAALALGRLGARPPHPAEGGDPWPAS